MRLAYIISLLTLLTPELRDRKEAFSQNDFRGSDPCPWHNLKKETTPNGNYFDFKLIAEGKYFLRWGNKSFNRILPDTFYCDAPPTNRPSFEQESDKYLVLRFGCGNPCWAGIFLPLNRTQDPMIIYHYYDFDLVNDLVASIDLDGEHTVILVDNLITKDQRKYRIEYICESAIPTYCMDSLSISGHKLYYRWTRDFTTDRKYEKIIKLE